MSTESGRMYRSRVARGVLFIGERRGYPHQGRGKTHNEEVKRTPTSVKQNGNVLGVGYAALFAKQNP